MMKRMTYVGALLIASFGLFMIQSCADPCKDVVCENGGTCDDEGLCDCPENYYGELCETHCVNGTYADGSCACDDYYEGDACTIEERIKFYGAYEVDEVCQGTNYDYISTIRKDNASNIYKVEISVLYQDFDAPIIAEIDGSTLSIPSQSPEDGFTISGSGSLSEDGNTVNISYTLNDASTGTVTCEATFNRQI